ncbi:uncharacterized protein M6D78_013631 [Vipera latastei]
MGSGSFTVNSTSSQVEEFWNCFHDCIHEVGWFAAEMYEIVLLMPGQLLLNSDGTIVGIDGSPQLMMAIETRIFIARWLLKELILRGSFFTSGNAGNLRNCDDGRVRDSKIKIAGIFHQFAITEHALKTYMSAHTKSK